MDSLDAPLSRAAASAAVDGTGWRLLLGRLHLGVAVEGTAAAVAALAAALGALAGDPGGHLRADVRPDRLELSLGSPEGGLTAADAAAAHAVADALGELEALRPGRLGELEIAVDALDPAAVRPFWQAVLGFVPEPGSETDPGGALVDPAGRLPSVWFQQMERPRPQRNRVHLDLTVASDEAPDRVAAAVAAGGRVLSDDAARAFWVLADPEGNEACVCTWQDRD